VGVPLFAQEEFLGSECTLRMQEEPEECGQVKKECDYSFDTMHYGWLCCHIMNNDAIFMVAM